MLNRERVLQRVEDDLQRGHTHVAIQRLTTLVQGIPTDLDLRRRLAAVHRSTGNLVEAGRWSYFEAERDQASVDAFERARQDPRGRLKALNWPRDQWGEAPERVRRTLEELEAAPRYRGAKETSEASRWDAVLRAGWAAFALVNVAAWGFGYVALVRWIW
ncbi:hypothetical protein EFK50_10525 [Nocardioides marmoriginsengisoli]|uniref:Uncharacterized protein n=1 Tax=Nocardioides marmoriginsengisoli TaxID=661483 RepID=A0A3N0CFK0_9ACTN|nr:DUF6584 family protein [Nocardioides marmoriginsengisoli]RNL62218.1 hypothetical protein EFK50_10525 [Nocardioides marmoriginsengisoli]